MCPRPSCTHPAKHIKSTESKTMVTEGGVCRGNHRVPKYQQTKGYVREAKVAKSAAEVGCDKRRAPRLIGVHERCCKKQDRCTCPKSIRGRGFDKIYCSRMFHK